MVAVAVGLAVGVAVGVVVAVGVGVAVVVVVGLPLTPAPDAVRWSHETVVDKILFGIVEGLGAARVTPWLVQGDRFNGQPPFAPARRTCARDGTQRALLLVADARSVGGESRSLARS